MRGFQVLIMTVLIVATAVTSVGAEITDRDVRQAIERGVEFLKTQQDKERGNWPEHTGAAGWIDSPLHAGPAQCGGRS